MKKLKAHPLADRLPEMTDSDYQQLKASVLALGKLAEPIVLLDGMILDGRHRYRVCGETGIEPAFVDFKKSWGDPAEFVISKSSHRNMTIGQKAVVAEAFMDDFAKSRGKEIEGRSAEYAGDRFGVARQYVDQVRQIRRASPELFGEIRAGKLNVNQAYNRFRHHDRSKQVRRVRNASASFSIDNCQIIRGDAIDTLDSLPRKLAKCIFIDSPYNIGLKYHGDKTGDRLSDAKFTDWCCQWLQAAVPVLTNDGSIFVMMPPKYAFELHRELTALGLHYRNTIAWVETFGSYQEGNLTECWRPILYFTRSDKFIWNPDVRIASDRQAKYGDSRANPHGKLVSNVWQIPRVQGTASDRVPFADAPPQLPLEIPRRCILLSTDPGDTVLDCFNGNGTTGVAALLEGRKYIGIEKSKLYAGQSEQWIASQLAKHAKGAN